MCFFQACIKSTLVELLYLSIQGTKQLSNSGKIKLSEINKEIKKDL